MAPRSVQPLQAFTRVRPARPTALGALAALVAACSGDVSEMPEQARRTLSAARIATRPTPPSPKPPLTPLAPFHAAPPVRPLTPPPAPPTATASPLATPSPTATPFVAPSPTATPTTAAPAETALLGNAAPFRGFEKLAAARGLAAFTVAISLSSLHDFSDLDRRPELNEALKLAKRYPQAPIFLTVYVTKADAHERNADPKELSDLMLVELARLIAGRGIAPERISGTGMGVDPAIGRRLIFSLDITNPR